EVADEPPIKLGIVSSDVEVPLVVGQALASLHQNDRVHLVCCSDRCVVLRKIVAVEDFVVLLNPADAFWALKVPEVDVAVDNRDPVCLSRERKGSEKKEKQGSMRAKMEDGTYVILPLFRDSAKRGIRRYR
ncbi:MAG: hypothetical protein ACI8W8_004994, partial [Rhodothermales bacterium]